MNKQINKLVQTGGGLVIVTQILQIMVKVFNVIVEILYKVVVILGPYILKFLLFCVGTAIMFCLFGFFGTVFTFFAVILMYKRLFKKIASPGGIFHGVANAKPPSKEENQENPEEDVE